MDDRDMRTVRRPRRYIATTWFAILRPAFRYSRSRDAFVLRGLGSTVGPVLRIDRRSRQRPFAGAERRHALIEQRDQRHRARVA
jgi:hypothetical protein